MTSIRNVYDGPYPDGVPNPYGMRVHAYPTRYHGPLYDRPMAQLPWVNRPYDFAVDVGLEGLGADEASPVLTATTPVPESAVISDVLDPRTFIECDSRYPTPVSVTSGEEFAAYAQNLACRERVKSGQDSRRWLIGISAVFIVGFLFGRKSG